MPTSKLMSLQNCFHPHPNFSGTQLLNEKNANYLNGKLWVYLRHYLLGLWTTYIYYASKSDFRSNNRHQHLTEEDTCAHFWFPHGRPWHLVRTKKGKQNQQLQWRQKNKTLSQEKDISIVNLWNVILQQPTSQIKLTLIPSWLFVCQHCMLHNTKRRITEKWNTKKWHSISNRQWK